MNIPRPNIKINKTWLMLIAAIVLSVLTAWLAMQYLKFREQSIADEMAARANQSRGSMVAVVVPVKSLPPGVILDETLVAARNVPVDFTYEDTVTVAQFDAMKGQALLRAVERGKPLRKADVREVFADFSGSLREGTRAMTINVDEINSVSHMVEPGNLVDIMLILSTGGEGGGSSGNQTVVPFLDQVKVLATGQKITHDDPAAQNPDRRISYSNLTLEVTPTQAARLALATELGKIRAVLRNEKDKQQVDYEAVNARNILDDIRERQKQASMKAARSRPSSGPSEFVEYIIGGKNSGTLAPTMAPALPGTDLSLSLSAAPTQQVASAGAPADASAQAPVPEALKQLMKLGLGDSAKSQK